MTAAMKLLYAAKFMSSSPRMVLLFGDEVTTRHFQGRSWMSQVLKDVGVEVQVVELPEETRAAILEAQKRQFR